MISKSKRILFSIMLLACLAFICSWSASTVQFKTATFETSEADSVARLTITCTPAPAGPVTVVLKRTGGSAQRSDFRYDVGSWWTNGLGIGFWGPGQSETTVELFNPADDGIPEPDETVNFTIVDLEGDAVFGSLTNAVVTIHNGSPRIAGQDWFSGELVTAQEGELLRCTLYRLGDTNGPMSVDYSTADDVARAGIDYLPATGAVTFAAGQISNHIQIATIDNSRVDGPRAFKIQLTNPSPGVSLLSTQIVAYVDDNELPLIWDRNFDARWPLEQVFAATVDGKLIASSNSVAIDGKLRIVRVNVDGSIDPTFAPVTTTPFNPANVVLDSVGRCLVLGNFDSVNGQPRSGLARLTIDGALDDTFRPSLAVHGSARIAIQPDGRLLYMDEQKFVRLNVDGSRDDTFHPAAATTNALHILATANNQAVTSSSWNGILTNGGWFYPRTNQPLVRLDPSGDVDSTFHRAQFITHSNQVLEIGKLVQQADGKLLVVGQFQSVDGLPRAGIVRLNADGTVDANFAPTPGAELDDRPARVPSATVDALSRVIITGEFNRINGQTSQSNPSLGRAELWTMARFNPDGTLDSTFGPFGDTAVGQRVPDLLSPNEIFTRAVIDSIMLQPDGNLLVIGTIWTRWKGCRSPRCFLGAPISRFLSRIYSEPPTNSFEFASARFVVKESENSATVVVRRMGDTRGAATVEYATSDGSAMGGQDYLTTTGTLRFAPLELAKSFVVPLLSNGVRIRDRNLVLTLTNASGVQTISGAKADLWIVKPFGFRFIASQGANARLTIFGGSGSSYILELAGGLDSPAPWWDGHAVTLTNSVQSISETPNWPQFYRLRRLSL